MKYFFIFFIFLVSAISSFAQDQCTNSLREAETKYEQGRLYEVPEMIRSCLKDGFTKEEKVRAYRLLTLTYLYLNYFDRADSSYLNLLKLSPEYKPNDELDPIELINHAAKFTTKPKFYFTIGKIGFNYAYSNVLLDYSLSQANNGSDKYSSLVGFQAGFGAEMVLRDNLRISAEILLQRSNVHLTDTHWDFYTSEMDLAHINLGMPILLKYYLMKNKIQPFMEIGVRPEFLSASNALNISGNYKLINEDGTEEVFPVQSRPKLSTTAMKNRFNYSLLLGGGMNYKIGLNYVVFEVQYAIGMLNVTNKNKRWREDVNEIRDLKFPIGHVDDDFRMENLIFSIGFVKPLYKPRKIK